MTKPETEKLPRLFSEWEQRVSDGELCARELWDQVRPHLRSAIRAQGGEEIDILSPNYEAGFTAGMKFEAEHRLVGATPDAAPDAVEWADEAMAMHWIDRYASGVDDEPQMDRVLDCVRVSPTDDAIIEFVRDVAANRAPHLHCRRAVELINAHARSAGGEG